MLSRLLRGLLVYPTTALAFLWRRLLRPLAPRRLLLVIEPPPLPPKTGPTELYLVRHGQSMHNISAVNEYGDTGADATLFDAPLSPLGEQQVAALVGNAELASTQLLISSPLTRAVQTLYGAFPQAPIGCPPVEMWAVAAEHLTDSCDIGSGAAALAKRFPALAPQMSALPEVWWYTDAQTSRADAEASRVHYRESGFMEPEATLVARIDEFVAMIRARPESKIALFGHSDYFNFLMERYLGVSGYWLENAEVYKIVLPAAGTACDASEKDAVVEAARGPSFVPPRAADEIERQALAHLGAQTAAALEAALGLEHSDGVAAMCARLAKDGAARHETAVASGEAQTPQTAFRYCQLLYEPCLRAQGGLSVPKAKVAMSKLWKASEAGSALKRWCDLLEETDRARHERETGAPAKV